VLLCDSFRTLGQRLCHRATETQRDEKKKSAAIGTHYFPSVSLWLCGKAHVPILPGLI
jgi:hypothetical protein